MNVTSRQYAAVRMRKIRRALEIEAASFERGARRIGTLLGFDEEVPASDDGLPKGASATTITEEES
jgi:hypothetical protein